MGIGTVEWNLFHSTRVNGTSSILRTMSVQEFGDVENFDRLASTMQSSPNIHQAASVRGYEDIGSGVQDAVHLVINHCAGDLRISDSKRSSETTTLVLSHQRN